jgi:hypothetical protein
MVLLPSCSSQAHEVKQLLTEAPETKEAKSIFPPLHYLCQVFSQIDEKCNKYGI